MNQKEVREDPVSLLLAKYYSLGRVLTTFRFRWACPAGRLAATKRTYYLSFHSILVGSWRVVIPTGTSPVEIGGNRRCF